MNLESDKAPEEAVADYVDVARRAHELGIPEPTGLAILPNNFLEAAHAGEFEFPSETVTVRKLFRAAGLGLDDLTPASATATYIHNKSVDWVAPTLFVTAGMLTQDPSLVSVSLNVMSNYISEFFRRPSRIAVKASIILEKERGRTYKKIVYEGDVSGLPTMAAMVKDVLDE